MKFRSFLIAAGFGGLLLGASDSQGGAIHGCLQPPKGVLRIVADPSMCSPKEQPISWNAEGAQGPKGEKGDPGDQGLAGQKCPPGEVVTGIDREGTIVCSCLEGICRSARADDPVGDGFPDLLRAELVHGGGSLTVTVTFAPNSFASDATRVVVYLDLDQDPATGHAGIGMGKDLDLMGVECAIEVGWSRNPQARILCFSGKESFEGVSYFKNGFTVTVPMSSLDGDDGKMNFKVLAAKALAPGPGCDGKDGCPEALPDFGLPGAALQ